MHFLNLWLTGSHALDKAAVSRDDTGVGCVCMGGMLQVSRLRNPRPLIKGIYANPPHYPRPDLTSQALLLHLRPLHCKARCGYLQNVNRSYLKTFGMGKGLEIGLIAVTSYVRPVGENTVLTCCLHDCRHNNVICAARVLKSDYGGCLPLEVA